MTITDFAMQHFTAEESYKINHCRLYLLPCMTFLHMTAQMFILKYRQLTKFNPGRAL
jgi:hypothetical protein